MKNFLKKTKNFILGKSNRIVRNQLFVLIITLSLLIFNPLPNVLVSLSPYVGVFYISFVYYIFCIYTASLFSIFMVFINDRIIEKTLESSEKYNKSLFLWLGEYGIYTKSLLYFNKKANENFDDINNLLEIKKILESRLGNELTNYYLYKNHLEFKGKKVNKKFNSFIMSICGVIITSLLIPFVKKIFKIDEVLDIVKISDILKELNVKFMYINYFGFTLSSLGIILAVYFCFKTIYSNLTEKSRRINYLISIIDILIKEKEAKKDEKKETILE